MVGSMASKANIALVALMLQNCSQFLLMKFALSSTDYLSSVAVLMQETVKFVLSFVLLYAVDGASVAAIPGIIKRDVFQKPRRAMLMLVPGIIYTVQNNLQYVAMNNLDSPTCSALYQVKLLTSAFFTVIILKRPVSGRKWLFLLLLFVGAVCVQMSTQQAMPEAAAEGAAEEGEEELAAADGLMVAILDDDEAANSIVQGGGVETHVANPVVGVMAVLAACVMSGVAGTFLELKLKDRSWSLWVKNIVLSFFGIVTSLFGVVFRDGAAVAQRGMFSGFTTSAWLVVLDVSCGGLLVAVVVKHADTIRKGFATTGSLVISTIVSSMFMGFAPPRIFFSGLLCVMTASLGYSFTAAAANASKPAAGSDKAADKAEPPTAIAPHSSPRRTTARKDAQAEP